MKLLRRIVPLVGLVGLVNVGCSPTVETTEPVSITQETKPVERTAKDKSKDLEILRANTQEQITQLTAAKKLKTCVITEKLPVCKSRIPFSTTAEKNIVLDISDSATPAQLQLQIKSLQKELDKTLNAISNESQSN